VVVQEAAGPYTNANSGQTITFPKTATSGNTLFLVVNWAAEAGGSFSTPSGWTLAVSQTATYAPLLIYVKAASGSETSVTFGNTISTQQGYCTGYFFEVQGDYHVLDQSSSSNPNDGKYSNPQCPSITPANGALVMAISCSRQQYQYSVNMGLDNNWTCVGVGGPNGSNPTAIALGLYKKFGTGVALKPPPFSSSCIAYSGSYTVATASFVS
jgi:hypothetical protein